MKIPKKALLCVSIVAILISGCSSSSSSSSLHEEPATEDNYPTIFDKTIAGNTVNDEKSVYDISDLIQIEDYKLITCAGFDKSYFLAAYAGEEDSLIIRYSLSEAKKTDRIEVSNTVFSDLTVIDQTEDGVFYLYDNQNFTLYFPNIDKESYEQVVLTKEPESILVVEGGARIFYTIKDDTGIYQYIKESEKSQLLFETDEVYELTLEYLAQDYDTIVTHVVMSDYTGYAGVSIEEQTFEVYEQYKDCELYYTGDEFIYVPDDSDCEIFIYNELKPRLLEIFSVDEKEELSAFEVYGGGPYLISSTGEDYDITLKLYDISEGIKFNEVELKTEYTLGGISFLKDAMNIYIHAQDKEGNYRFLIWDVESVTDVIS